MPIAELQGNDTNDDKWRTFVIDGEGHTLGNALRCIVSSFPDVQFCGYTVPHPAENRMHFRIQMHNGKAIDALRKGLQDLVRICDHTVDTFTSEMLSYETKNSMNNVV